MRVLALFHLFLYIMDMATDAKNYEVAYLMPPSVSEEEVLVRVEKLAKTIEEEGGTVRRAEEPKKRHLSYEIKKEWNAYFGWTSFRAAPMSLNGITKKIKNENFLRFLIVEEEDVRTFSSFQRSIPSRSSLQPAPQPRETEKAEEKLDLEALDKKLEEILGK